MRSPLADPVQHSPLSARCYENHGGWKGAEDTVHRGNMLEHVDPPQAPECRMEVYSGGPCSVELGSEEEYWARFPKEMCWPLEF